MEGEYWGDQPVCCARCNEPWYPPTVIRPPGWERYRAHIEANICWDCAEAAVRT